MEGLVRNVYGALVQLWQWGQNRNSGRETSLGAILPTRNPVTYMAYQDFSSDAPVTTSEPRIYVDQDMTYKQTYKQTNKQTNKLRGLIPQSNCKTTSMVYWSEFLATDPRGPGSIPGATGFSKSSGSGTGSTQPPEYN
jgi:hypothetical protein